MPEFIVMQKWYRHLYHVPYPFWDGIVAHATR